MTFKSREEERCKKSEGPLERNPRGAMKDRRVPVADNAVRLAVGPGPSQKYPEGGDPRPGPARKGQEILKVSAGRLTREEEANPARGRVGI